MGRAYRWVAVVLVGVWVVERLAGVPAYAFVHGEEGALWVRVLEALWAQANHANVFHLGLNVWALWGFRPRWGTLAVGVVCSTAVLLMPVHGWLYGGTLGVSGVVFGCYARTNYRRWRVLWLTLATQVPLLLVPQVNVVLHVGSYVLGCVVWWTFGRIRTMWRLGKSVSV